MKRILLVLLFTVGSHAARSQSTIAYTDGPPFQIPWEFAPATVDLDRDGSPDFSLISGFVNCTMDIPTSMCTWSFHVTALNTNAFLIQTNYAAVRLAGDWIGPDTATNDVWWGGGHVTLLTWWWSERLGTSGARGPLGTLGEGYLGVRFSSADGIHYGWVHVRDTLVMDWAYETRPGVPIRAGARPVLVPLASPRVVRPGYLRLNAATEVGKAYQVQVKGHLDAFPWTNLPFIIPATTTNTTLDLPMTAPAQFFRVVEAD
ncbi:MAG TPA: hypothetical protein PKN95_15175 [Verrucomicrobiota bacterium]|nr:hypothetical protein [Verrucomicrobiota bacterium]HNT15373.1 hypothetical protein [Verrucomicrobiota bacterium]